MLGSKRPIWRPIYLTVRGGRPDLIGCDIESDMPRKMEYVRRNIEDDIPGLDNASLDVLKLKKHVRSLAWNESTRISDRRIIADIKENDETRIAAVTLSKYRSCIDRVFLTADQPAFISTRGQIAERTSGGPTPIYCGA